MQFEWSTLDLPVGSVSIIRIALPVDILLTKNAKWWEYLHGPIESFFCLPLDLIRNGERQHRRWGDEVAEEDSLCVVIHFLNMIFVINSFRIQNIVYLTEVLSVCVWEMWLSLCPESNCGGLVSSEMYLTGHTGHIICQHCCGQHHQRFLEFPYWDELWDTASLKTPKDQFDFMLQYSTQMMK